MVAVLDMPTIKDARAFHLQRWEEICSDPYFQALEGRVETNCYGQAIMMPPPGFSRSNRQGAILSHLLRLIESGRALPEVAVLTSDGVKEVDVAWISEDRVRTGLAADVLTKAPEICVEVLSGRNTREEMDRKQHLYFEAGADEVWFCDHSGSLHFFLKSAPDIGAKSSLRCAGMAEQV